MKLRDIFSFRDPPESEASKPFLEHLEDLRWTIVKMAITLMITMVFCFAFRQEGCARKHGQRSSDIRRIHAC